MTPRQIDLPGVHTKFVEEHRQLLAALLECVLPPEAIDTTCAHDGHRTTIRLITENEINFLALPPVPDAIAVFGAGSGLEHLAGAPWLASCPVYYWGDIDTHGFWILDQLRAVVPHARSLLMDRHTLLDHREFWGTEQPPHRRDLARLTNEERELYDDLRDNRIATKLRLEQERIRFSAVPLALRAIH